jgi:hypothetical protein
MYLLAQELHCVCTEKDLSGKIERYVFFFLFSFKGKQIFLNNYRTTCFLFGEGQHMYLLVQELHCIYTDKSNIQRSC